MKNSGRAPLPSKDDVIAQVIDTFVYVIGFIERHEVSHATNVDKDFRIDTDDITLFLQAVERRFGIHPPPKEWLTVTPTIEGIAEFVLRHLQNHLFSPTSE